MARRGKPTQHGDDGTIRTTVSIREDVAARLRHIATKKAMSSVELIRLAVQQFVEFEEAGGPSAYLRELVESTREMRNHYQAVVASWRLARTREQVRDISTGGVTLRALSAERYLLQILAELQERLDGGDELLVATGKPFWESATAAIDERYLHPNELREYLKAQGFAVGRGMRVFRVIVLREDEERSSGKLIELHHRFLQEVREKYPDRSAHVKVHVKLVKRSSPPAQIPLFACVRRVREGEDLPSKARDAGCLIVKPRYSSKPEITELNLIFSNGPTREDQNTKPYLDEFLNVAHKSIPVEEFRELLKSRR